MGGNGAYIRSESGVPDYKRTHTDIGDRVDGHKVLIQKKNENQVQIPMNSNSDNPKYLCGKVGKDGSITIETIAIYDKHKIVETIDIVIDKNGNFVPYTNGGKNSSHSHKWEQDDSGNMGRKSHDKSNSLPIDPKYQSLIDAVIAYNKAGKKWKN